MMSRKGYIILASGILIAFLFFGVWLLYRSWFPYTADAYVEGNPVVINSLREGVVTRIRTDDSFPVTQFDTVVELNHTDVDIRFAEAREQLALETRRICEAFHRVFRLAAEVREKEALSAKAAVNFNNRKAAVTSRAISREEFQFARDDLLAAQSALLARKKALEEAYAFVQGQSISNHPGVQAAAWAFRDAWVQRYRSNIRAPVSGLIANRKVQVGMTVRPNLPLMSVIPLDQIWVNANFKETAMKHLRIGQRATVWSDYYGSGVKYHGTVVGLPGAAGDVFSLLPTQNLSGNWIKIVQRLPVRIALNADELEKHPLRLGLSMHVTVNATGSGSLLPAKGGKSPGYSTSVFDKEELGVQAVVQKIIQANMDPDLARYFTKPLDVAVVKPVSRAAA
ncbi:HlyD family secretion protein [Legionella spiritensis]|uniref:HlyD family secretion protein n=1 Tax=Legionella spiritensis TaxID=452 RepID=UPI000F82BB1E|nr:efflux RND transporter periplasmic adaptor subunit [Legionella spiritensis]